MHRHALRSSARSGVYGLTLGLLGLLAGALLGGCPGQVPLEYIAGGEGDRVALGDVASVTVLTPVSDLAVTGGAPVEVNWRVVATTRFAAIDVIFDVDQDPDNDNEITSISGTTIEENSALLDTTTLDAGTYYIGVVLREVGATAAFGYAPGRLVLNQRPRLYFDAPRDVYRFDRTNRINPNFEVSWTVTDPDSTISVQVFLDPDDSANGNEVLLRESDSQTGDSFTFDLPTDSFEPGAYRILALVSDGVDSFPFYAPATIHLRARLAGFIDLRDMHLPTSEVRGAVFEGFNPRDNTGSFVTTMGDIDGDGFSDILILAQFGKPRYEAGSQRNGIGEAYLVYGRRDRFSGMINLNSTGTLFRGDIFEGVPEVPDPIRPSRGISSFAMLSDWDGDGVREMAFGLPFTDSLSMLFAIGTADPFVAAPLDVNGYFRTGAAVIAAGSCLRPDLGYPGRQAINLGTLGTLAHEPVGCVNCDPDDPCPCPEGFYGPKAASTVCSTTYFHRHWADINGTPNDGSVRLGARFSSNEFGDMFGETVSAFDFDAIIMSAPNRDPFIATIAGESIIGAGVVSIYFVDSAAGFFPWADTQAPPANEDFGYGGPVGNPSANLIPHGGPYHYIIDDFRVFQILPGRALPGSPGYVVDPDDGEPCVLRVSVDSPGLERTTRIWGGSEGARISNAVGVSDFNADGLSDILIGSPLSNEGRGSCFIVLGRLRSLMWGGELPIEELGLPMGASDRDDRRIFDGIRVLGAPGARLGESQDGAGDFNNDGIADVVIGSPLVNSRRGGVAVFYGSREVINLTQEEIPFDEISSRGLGVIFEGEEEGDLAGARVTGAGDIDGDGVGDIMIAAPNRSVQLDIDLDGMVEIDRTNCGVVYLIYGDPDYVGRRLSLADVGTAELPGAVFIGRASGDFLGAGLGDQGDRSRGIAGAGDVDADGFRDLLISSVSAAPRDRVAAGEAYLLYGRGD